MKCPKCSGALSRIEAAYGSTVERCDSCQGVFVGVGALDMLQREWFLWPRSDPSTIDAGDPRIGKRLDTIADIDCPGCGVRMLPISVKDQQHIWLERCPGCGGVFFDAGELTDLRYKTLADWVRSYLKGPRSAPGA